MNEYRELPHNIEAEQQLLGAVFMNRKVLDRVSSFLTDEHFYEPLHGRLYAACIARNEKGQSFDPVVLKDEFEHDEALQEVGGVSYLVTLAGSAVSIISAKDFADEIYKLFVKRRLIYIGEELSDLAVVTDDPVSLVDETVSKLFGINIQTGDKIATLAQATDEAIRVIETAYKSPDSVTGVTTGLTDLDKLLGGFHKPDLTILAGRPAMGKTALAVNSAYRAACKGVPSAFFSMEMSRDQLARRIISEELRLDGEKLRLGDLTQDEFGRVARVNLDKPLYIDHTPSLSIALLRSKLRTMVSQYGVKIAFIDYLGLMQSRAENRVAQISEITRGLKSIAMELQIPIIALSQLSREVEKRDNKRPLLSDLRDSGTIEQDADQVIFVYRGEYYLEKLKPDEGDKAYGDWQMKMEKLQGEAEIIVAKQRHGPTDTVKTIFIKNFTSFKDRAYG